MPLVINLEILKILTVQNNNNWLDCNRDAPRNNKSNYSTIEILRGEVLEKRSTKSFSEYRYLKYFK